MSLTIHCKRFLIVCIFCLAFLFPISLNGELLSDAIIALEWLFLALLLLCFAVIDRVSTQRFLIALSLFLYLLFATIIVVAGKKLSFSLARVAPVMCSLLALSINVKPEPDTNFLRKIFDIFVFITIAINILLLLQVSFVSELIINYYTQYYNWITQNFILTYRPIGIFGVGNIASFFYMIIFIISALFYEKTRERKYNYYMLFMALFCLLIRNTTSLGSIVFMALYYLDANKQKKKMVYAAIAIIILGLLFLGSSIYSAYQENLQQKANGVVPRYFGGEGSIFKQNFEMLKEYKFGIGYTLDKYKQYNLLFADSGYIVYLTMGNIIFPLGLYYLFYLHLRANVSSVRFRRLIFAYVLAMELGFITFLSLRTVCLIHITILYFKTLEGNQ